MNREKKLSKGLLDLKFMKRSKEKAERQEEDEERQNLYQDELAKLHEGADRVVMINSYYDCMNFLPCRLSFGGADIDIEKLNEDRLTGLYRVEKKKKEHSTGMEVDISAAEFRAGPEDYSTEDRFLGDKTWTRDINRGRRGDHRGGGNRGRGGDRRGGGNRGRGGDHRGGRGSRGGDHRGRGSRGGDRGRGSRGGDRGRAKQASGPNRFDQSRFGKSYQHQIMPIRDSSSDKKESDESQDIKSKPSGKRKSDESNRQTKFLKPSD